jgi:hypothetical protein
VSTSRGARPGTGGVRCRSRRATTIRRSIGRSSLQWAVPTPQRRAGQ